MRNAQRARHVTKTAYARIMQYEVMGEIMNCKHPLWYSVHFEHKIYLIFQLKNRQLDEQYLTLN